MPLIWAAISAHGYGHAAQVVPVLNALGALVPHLHALMRTTVPASFFRDRLTIPWKISPVQQDVGCVQNGPLAIDIDATWREHRLFHAAWDARVKAEVEAMQAARPAVVLADAPYLALEAARLAGVPSIAHVSLTWDLVLAELPSPPDIDRARLLDGIRHAYRCADLALRMTPAPPLDLFRNRIDIGPIAEPAAPRRDDLADRLQLAPGDQTVLVGFGGVPLESLPFARLEELAGYRFLFDGPVPDDSRRVVSAKRLPFSFKSLLASVDIIMTKPGYGTIVEAVALTQPVVYVRRYNFADEEPIVAYLHRHGRAVLLDRDDFSAGRWVSALQRVLTLPHPAAPPPPATGAVEAAARLKAYFST